MKPVIDSIVTDACIGLFASVGAPLRPATTARHDAEHAEHDEAAPVASIITFAGPELSGTLLLVSSFELIAACMPREVGHAKLSASSSGDWIFVRDWAKELSNQLIGRIKNRLGAQGLAFESRTPIALTGAAVSAEVAGRTDPPHRFVTAAGRVELWFDTRILGGEAPTVRPGADTFAQEGDVILF